MGKAANVLSVLNPLLEATISVNDFRSALEELNSVKSTSSMMDYYFKLPSLMQHKDLFNELIEWLESNGSRNHAPNAYTVTARVNSDKDEDHGYLWDAGLTVRDGKFLVDGNGAPSGGGGHARVIYDESGKMIKIDSDNLKGIHIEQDEAQLESVSVDATPELYDILKQGFGPSGSK